LAITYNPWVWDIPAQPKFAASLATPASLASTTRPFPLPTVCSSRRTSTYFLVRTRNTPMTMAETIRRHLHNVEPMRSAYDFAPLEQHYSDALAENLLKYRPAIFLCSDGALTRLHRPLRHA